MTQEEKSVYSVYFGKSAVTRHWPGSRNWYLHEVNMLKTAPQLPTCAAPLGAFQTRPSQAAPPPPHPHHPPMGGCRSNAPGKTSISIHRYTESKIGDQQAMTENLGKFTNFVRI